MAEKMRRRVTREEILNWWEERFGVSRDVFEDYDFYQKGDRIWIVPKDAAEALNEMRCEVIGMSFMRVISADLKPTTSAIQLFGRFATRNVVELDASDAFEFMQRRSVHLGAFRTRDLTDGYVVVKFKGRNTPLGCGVLRGNELKSLIPKDRSVEQWKLESFKDL
ncbi:MAG TPA: hypothetical protein ENF26_02030 [Methanomicrobia archaeon]|nr:hypothetical protein [Methanomicrobia archaeon]HEX58912.1 hypothetical protein [Methanomicrobia archaeon]